MWLQAGAPLRRHLAGDAARPRPGGDPRGPDLDLLHVHAPSCSPGAAFAAGCCSSARCARRPSATRPSATLHAAACGRGRAQRASRAELQAVVANGVSAMVVQAETVPRSIAAGDTRRRRRRAAGGRGDRTRRPCRDAPPPGRPAPRGRGAGAGAAALAGPGGRAGGAGVRRRPRGGAAGRGTGGAALVRRRPGRLPRAPGGARLDPRGRRHDVRHGEHQLRRPRRQGHRPRRPRGRPAAGLDVDPGSARPGRALRGRAAHLAGRGRRVGFKLEARLPHEGRG